ncbi:MAG: RecB family exonuclease [Planctomycetota bacterium]|jgi:CRISPR/Cas system-associated exonuclease Cas4 (RecB family)
MTSKSELQRFHTCPGRWDFGKKKYPAITLDRTPLYFGSEVHRGIAEYQEEVQSGRVLNTKNSIQEAIERHLREIDGDPKRIEKIVRNLTDWEWERYQVYGKENMPPLFVEKRFDIAPFKGYIDCVFSTGVEKEVIIVDWKTGSYHPDDWMNVQLTIYIYALEKMGYKVKQALIIFVEHGMRTLGIRKLNEVMQLANTFFKRTGNPNYHYPKNRGWWCKWCEYQLLCQFEDNPPMRGVQTIITTEQIEMFLRPREVLVRPR